MRTEYVIRSDSGVIVRRTMTEFSGRGNVATSRRLSYLDFSRNRHDALCWKTENGARRNLADAIGLDSTARVEVL